MDQLEHMLDGANDLLAHFATLPVSVAATAERIFWWERDDLRRLASKLRLGSAYFASIERKTHAAIVVDLSTRYVDAYGDDGAMNTALRVATVIENRWYEAGHSRWVRDDRGYSVARNHDAACAVEYAFLVSPSGKALFRCRSCERAPSISPGVHRAVPCDGRSSAALYIAPALVAGVRYEPWKGIPVPMRSDLEACRRCWAFGHWTMRDNGSLVCNACAGKAPGRYPV